MLAYWLNGLHDRHFEYSPRNCSYYIDDIIKPSFNSE